jgi:type III restriction enzyme
VDYFEGKLLQTVDGTVVVNHDMAVELEFYLIQNGYVDKKREMVAKYHQAVQQETLAPLPPALEVYQTEIYKLIDTVFSVDQLPPIDDDRRTKFNPLNANFEKKEFQELWNQINRKAVYTVHFDTDELVQKCIATLGACRT